MAEVRLTPQTIDKDGLSGATYTPIDATDNYVYKNGAKTFAHFKNSGSESTVTFVTPGNVSGQPIADDTLTVPATTGDVFYAAQPTSLFNDPSGDADFSQDIASGVTVAILQIG